MLKRFVDKTKASSNGCLEWAGALFTNGYGAFQFGGKLRKAHRVAWEMENGPIPEGMFVCHNCDNPKCVNVAHLFIGSPQDNNNDMRRKGRARYPGPQKPPRGSRHHKAILTENAVKRIRLIGRTMRQSELAECFGVSKQTISAVLNNHVWQHIKHSPMAGIWHRTHKRLNEPSL